ncbi:MAG: M24 family metallopeptidase [Syntrophales bacterium]
MNKVPKSELYSRISALQAHLGSTGIDGALVVQNADLFYFCGTVAQAYLFIPAVGEPLLLVRKNPQRIRQESSLDLIIPVSHPRDVAGILSDHGYRDLKRLGMELDVLPVSHYFRYLKSLKPQAIVDISLSIQSIRSIKSGYEIDLIRQAGRLSDFMVETARRTLREGITEVELAAAIEMAARVRGHQGYVRMRSFNQEIYWGAVVSGPDAAEPAFIDLTQGGRGTTLALPAGAGPRPINRHEPVLVDLAAAFEGYNADQTRTLCLGRLPEKLETAYNVSVEILQSLEAAIRPGLSAHELFAEAERICGNHGLAEHFMGYGSQKAGFCGHGIGIELDELPVITKENKAVLSPGMVFALEPKFTFPGLGVVGVEDAFAVTETGCLRLTGAGYSYEAQ